MMQQLFRIYSLRIFGEKVSRVFERGYIFFFRKSLDLKKERREREKEEWERYVRFSWMRHLIG